MKPVWGALVSVFGSFNGTGTSLAVCETGFQNREELGAQFRGPVQLSRWR